MNFLLLKKTGSGAIIFFLILFLVFSPLGDITPKANAMTFGEALGKAAAAGAACFAAFKAEEYVLSLKLDDALSIAEGKKEKAKLLLDESIVLYVPVVDRSAPPQMTGTMVLKDQTRTSLDKSKDCIRDVVAKIIGDWIVDQVVIWIQGGGKPRFVTDWKKFTRDAVNAGVGEAVSQTGAAFLCSPFKLQVQIALLPVKRFQQRLECTLDGIVKNINNFFGDFRNGNWIAYRQLWYPQNNYYGTLIMVHDEAVARALAEKNAAEEEAIAGQGFMGVRKCRLVVNAENPEGYEKCSIVTPGYAVGETVAEAITTDIRWAENIKSWTSAVVNALINAAIQKVMKKGLASGDYQYSYSNSEYDYKTGTLPTVKNIPENYGLTYEDITNCNSLSGQERDNCYENLKKEKCDKLENEKDKNDCRTLLDEFLQDQKEYEQTLANEPKTPSEVPSGGGGGGEQCTVVSSSDGGACSNGNTELIRTYSCPSLSKCQERENKWSSEGNQITEGCSESNGEYMISAIFCT